MNTLMSKMSLRVQLLLIFTLVFTLAFAAFTFVFYREFSTYAENLVKERLQSVANELSVSIATSVTGEEVLEITEEGEESPARDDLIEYFNDVQTWYEDIDIGVTLTKLDRAERSAIHLIQLPIGADESKPIETDPIVDDEWDEWVEGTEAALYYDITSNDEGLWLRASDPLFDENGEPVDAMIEIQIRTDRELAAVRKQIRDTLLTAVAVGYPLLLLVIFLVSFTFTRSLKRLTTAATAIEQDEPYQQEWLQPVVRRGDEIGRLGRVFDKMASQVKARVDRLKSEVFKLQIEIDQSRKQQQVAEITDSDYFKDLQEKAISVRRRIPKLDGDDNDDDGNGSGQ